MPHRRIKVKGIRREQIDTDKLAFAYWLMAKRAVEEKRKRGAEDRKKRAAAGTQSGKEPCHAER